MPVNLGIRRALRDAARLAGRRGAEGKRAVTYDELAEHPIIKVLAQGTGLSAEVQAELEALGVQITTAQDTADGAQAEAEAASSIGQAAQATADGAATVAANALADAAAAQADLDGFAAAHAGVTVQVDGSGYVSGFLATTWANPDGTGGSVLELLGSVVAQGTIATNRLTVGLGLNWLRNTQFLAPLDPGWATHEANGAAGTATTISINAADQPYAWPSLPTLSIYQSDGSTTGYFDATCLPLTNAAGDLAPGYAVTEGERVSLSARMSAHRCTGELLVGWYDGAGTLLSVTNSANAVDGNFTTSSAGPAGSSTNPDLWDQLWMLADAPTGVQVAYARPIFRKGPSGSGDANSELFIARPMFCESHANATTFTPYNPDATTLIDGNQILTGTITADKLFVSSISVLSSTLGTFQSAVSGERLEINDTSIKVYDSTGTLRVRIGDLSA